MKQTGYRAIYDRTGRVNFADLEIKRPGVYLIKENGRLVYIEHSKINMYRTMIRHFEYWSSTYGWNVTTYRDRLKRKKYTVKVILTTAAQAARMEKALIQKHRPRDNKEKYLEAAKPKAKKTARNYLDKKDVPF